MKINESKLVNIIKECFNEVVKEELAGYGISDHMNNGEEKLQEVDGYGVSGQINNVQSDVQEMAMKKNNNRFYTHYAVNKATGKIVNGWDYRGYDPEELRQFKKDYFISDLIDYELDPKQYTILTKKSLIQRGINPDDNANWSMS